MRTMSVVGKGHRDGAGQWHRLARGKISWVRARHGTAGKAVLGAGDGGSGSAGHGW